jgi:uncharacterized protein (TIGR02284 family)
MSARVARGAGNVGKASVFLTSESDVRLLAGILRATSITELNVKIIKTFAIDFLLDARLAHILKGMQMKTDDLISTLNNLIETSRDGDEGFSFAAAHARDQSLSSLLESRAQSCAFAVRELQELVQKAGGAPATSGTVGARLHRRWVAIKSAIIAQNDESILKECERGEDVAVHNYRDALKNDLPEEVRRVVQRQFQGVMRNHDQIKTLRDREHEFHH